MTPRSGEQEVFDAYIGLIGHFKNDKELLAFFKRRNKNKELISGLKEKLLGSALIRHLCEEKNPMGLVLRTHLYLENFLDEIIKKKLKNGSVILENRSFTFRSKLDVLRATNYLDEKIYNDISLINSIRNKYAHNLFFDIGTYDLGRFTYCAELKEKMAQVSNAEIKRLFNMFIFSAVAQHLLLRLTQRHPFISDLEVP